MLLFLREQSTFGMYRVWWLGWCHWFSYGTDGGKLTYHYFTIPQKEAYYLGAMKGFRGSAIIGFMIRWFLSQRLVKIPYWKNMIHSLSHAQIIVTCVLYIHKLWFKKQYHVDPRRGRLARLLCDRHLVVSKENILDSLNIIPQLIQKPYTFDLFTMQILNPFTNMFGRIKRICM